MSVKIDDRMIAASDFLEGRLLFRAYTEAVEQGKSVRVLIQDGNIIASPPSAEKGVVRLNADIVEHFRYGESVTFILSEIVATLRKLEFGNGSDFSETTAQDEDDGMLPEYNFSGSKGVRGKYGKISSENAIVRIIEKDGSITLRPFDYKEDTVYLPSELQEYFPDADTVNNILRALIPALQKVKAQTE